MYQLKGPVPNEEYTIPLGVAEVKRAGGDITLVATSSMVQVALAAAEYLQTAISAEVVDMRLPRRWTSKRSSSPQKNQPRHRH